MRAPAIFDVQAFAAAREPQLFDKNKSCSSRVDSRGAVSSSFNGNTMTPLCEIA